MARRIGYTDRPDRGAWLADADTYRQHQKGLNSIAVLEADGKIKWMSSSGGDTMDELINVSRRGHERLFGETNPKREARQDARALDSRFKETRLNRRWSGSPLPLF